MAERLIASPEAMKRFGAELARQLSAGDVVLLNGDLGAGKTTLVQGIAAGLGIAEPVTSPTFTLVAEHPLVKPVRGIERVYHLDLYRLTDPHELESFGYDDFLAPSDAISLIEWPERAADWLPDRALLIEIDHRGENKRAITVRALGAQDSVIVNPS
jgi:tRNA threonylcarbamoyladenosine biosynthesis protein TsaE